MGVPLALPPGSCPSSPAREAAVTLEVDLELEDATGELARKPWRCEYSTCD